MRRMDPITKVILAVLLFMTLLVGIVVIVGLLTSRLDTTGVATMLGGVITGIMGGLFMRWHKNDDQGDN